MTIDDLVESFEFLDNWEDRYRLLIDMGRELPEFPEEARIEENRVEGCTSNVWLVHDTEDGAAPRIRFQADSDAFIVKGLIAVILMAYSGRTPEEIRQTDIEALFTKLGLEQQLTPNRRNGFFAMVERIHEIADREAA
ncbi:cysteine desulfuration protein SufE [Natronocella acetinitrilica]|uniref:Cysteine desulfuration protein SufE n=1 Tax=Natronocella acetinitrilica TaxID=414046 RepID=A0AAE3G112_9GAMM|nr:SufE family protein [Natronocella acetinitrilica]MCP1673651.1 cysteine desulfuration protein SufE [Natronocella acetinitrilica]